MTSYSKLLKDTGIIGTTGAIKALREIILLPILIKTLGPESYGVWAQITVTITLLVPLLSMGLPFALVRFLAAEKSKREIQDGVWSVATTLLLTGSAAMLLFFLFSHSIASPLNLAPPFITLLGFIILLETLNLVFLNVFRAFQLARSYALFSIAQILAEIILVSFVVLKGHGIEAALMVLFGVRFALFALTAAFILFRIGFSVPRFQRMRQYIAFALPTVPGNIAAWVVLASDRYLIHFFLGLVFVGYYAPASTIGGFLILLVSPLAFVLPAALSKLADEHGLEQAQKYLTRLFKWFLLIAVPSVFGLTVLSKQILTIFTTPEAAAQAFLVVPLTALSFLFFGVMVFFAQPLILRKKTKPYGFVWAKNSSRECAA